MNSNQNTEEPKRPYNFYFADQLNVSIERRDSRSSSISSDKMTNSIKLMKEDQVIENGGKKHSLGRQVSFDSVVDNEFMLGYGDSAKNISHSNINNQSDIFHEIDRNKDQKHTLISKLQQSPEKQVQNQNENSFLLGTQTYKEICISQHNKKTQLNNVLDSSNNLGGGNNICQIHDSPFEIVCIQDKSLICSHCAIFGDHKTHSLAPLKQMDKFIHLKRQQVNDIIADYKSLQLGIKQKAFMSEFSQKIRTKKGETIISIAEAFKSMRQFMDGYENEIMSELQVLYISLESKISEAIKRISLDSNRAAFQKWQQDATKIVQQLGFKQLNKVSQIGLFLSNFKVPLQISNSIQSKQSLEMISLQAQGKQYLNEIEEELNLNINEVMKISSHFRFSLNPDYQDRIKELMMFEADAQLQGLMQDNQLTVLLAQLNNQTHNNPTIHVRNSFSHFNNNNNGHTNKSIALNIKQHERSSTINTTTQSMPFFSMAKNKRITSHKNNCTHKNNQPHSIHEPLLTATSNVSNNPPLKFKKRQTCCAQQPTTRRMEMSVRSVDVPFSLINSKSFCLENQRNRRISPCPRNIVKVQNQHLFVSAATARLKRCSSREPANIYSPNHIKQRENFKDFKIKTQTSQNSQPLQAIQHYQNTQTQTFDLSNFQLSDTEIIYFVQKASKIRKIKHLKLTGNQLTTSGLQKILGYLPNCNLMNLSNNKLSENTIDLLLKKRQRIMQLRLLNLANNKLNERKIKQKISEFKRMGIVVTL